MLNDSYLQRSSISKETKSVKLSKILESLRKRANATVTSEGFTRFLIVLPNGSEFSLSSEVSDLNKLFSDFDFLRNYNYAFQSSFPSDDNLLIDFDHIAKIKIINDLVTSDRQSISDSEINTFKSLTCLFFGYYFHVKLKNCNCYPHCLKDFIAFQIGLYKNCIDYDCRKEILEKPEIFDPLVHSTNCSENETINFVYNSVNVSGENIKIYINTNQC